MNHANRFKNQVVLITGASSGIGEALARQFRAEGANVALLARRRDRLERLVRELGSEHALSVECDVTRDGDLERAVRDVVIRFGRIDTVVANAGFSVTSRLEDLKLEDYRRQFETNVFGLLRTIYASLDELKKTRGRLALIGSVMGHVSLPQTSPYAMSKYAVRALAEAITEELRPEGISVTLISPGFVSTEIRMVDNKGIFHSENEDYVPAWIQVPAARAAREITSAIYRRKKERVVTGHGKVIVALSRLFPPLLEAVKKSPQGPKIRSKSR